MKLNFELAAPRVRENHVGVLHRAVGKVYVTGELEARRREALMMVFSAFDNYLALLKSPDPRDRYSAASGLALSRDPRAVKPLIGVLHDADWNVRFEAAKALGAIGDKSAIEPLFRALNTATTGQFADLVRAAITIALGELGDRRISDALSEISQNGPNTTLQKRAGQVLLKLREQTATSTESNAATSTATTVQSSQTTDQRPSDADLLREALFPSIASDAQRWAKVMDEVGVITQTAGKSTLAAKLITEAEEKLSAVHREIDEAVARGVRDPRLSQVRALVLMAEGELAFTAALKEPVWSETSCSDRAIAAYEKAFAIREGDARSYMILGISYFRVKKYAEALSNLQKAEAKDVKLRSAVSEMIAAAKKEIEKKAKSSKHGWFS